MARRDRPEHRWVLDYHAPGPSTAPGRFLRHEDDDDEAARAPGDDEGPPPTAPGQLLAQLEGLHGPGSEVRGPLGAEVVRCLGGEVLGVDLVLPGERVGPLGGATAEVEVDEGGRCLVTVPAADASVVESSGPGRERPVACPVAGLEVPPAGRVLVRHGDSTLLVRPVAVREPWREGLGRRVVLASLALGALLALLYGAIRWLAP